MGNPYKRMIYIQPDNKEYFDALKNKSGLINRLLREQRQKPADAVELNQDYVMRKLARIDGNRDPEQGTAS